MSAQALPVFPSFVRVQDVPRRGGQSADLCKTVVYALLALALVVALCSRRASHVPMMVSQGISTMRAHLANFAPQAAPLPDAHAPCALGPYVVNLTPCSQKDGNCADIDKMDDTHKDKYLAQIVKFNEENPEAMFIIYASWCQHCHKAMPHFVDASKRSKLKFAVINGDMIPPKALHDLGVTHYPYIVHTSPHGNSVLKEQPTVESIRAHANKTAHPLDQYF